MATNPNIVLKPSIVAASNCQSLNFNELTGAYSLVNPTGWGAPNVDIDTALTATLDITLQDGTVIPQIDLYDSFPSADPTFPTWNISGTTLGYGSGASIPSQVITAIYTVTGDDSGGIGEYSITTTIQVPILCTLECCVSKMGAAWNPCKCKGNCNCKNSAFTDGWNTLEAIKGAFLCDPPNVDRAIELIDYLNDVCLKRGCGCC